MTASASSLPTQRIPKPKEFERAFHIWRYSHPSQFVRVRALFNLSFFPDAWINIELPFNFGLSYLFRSDPQTFNYIFGEWVLFDYVDEHGYSLAEAMAFDDPSLRDWSLYQRYSRFQVMSADKSRGTVHAVDIFSGVEFTIHDELMANMPNVLVGTHGTRITKVGGEWYGVGADFHDLDVSDIYDTPCAFVDDARHVFGC